MNKKINSPAAGDRRYRHLFFDIDHTLWDFDSNSRQTLVELYEEFRLEKIGIHDFDLFHKNYLVHNEVLWERYRNGHLKVEEMRWKRMWLTLLDFKIGNEALAREMGVRFLELLPLKKILFPYTLEILNYLKGKQYHIHLITNGFEKNQHHKLKNSGLDIYFTEVITSEGSNSLKPHREIFEFALDKAGAQKKESIMLGDSLDVDVRGARDAGIDQVFVNHLGIMPAFEPTYMVNSLKELEDIF